eukprot:4759591-Alexandrium_andersonii.AAC.1
MLSQRRVPTPTLHCTPSFRTCVLLKLLASHKPRACLSTSLICLARLLVPARLLALARRPPRCLQDRHDRHALRGQRGRLAGALGAKQGVFDRAMFTAAVAAAADVRWERPATGGGGVALSEEAFLGTFCRRIPESVNTEGRGATPGRVPRPLLDVISDFWPERVLADVQQ